MLWYFHNHLSLDLRISRMGRHQKSAHIHRRADSTTGIAMPDASLPERNTLWVAG